MLFLIKMIKFIYIVVILLFIISSILYLCSKKGSDKMLESFNLTEKHTLYNGDYWEEYRIGDLYKFGTFIGCKQKNESCENDDYHSLHFPFSIAFYYHMYNYDNIVSNTEAMYKAVKKVNEKFNIPKADCVLHVRVGDVMTKKNKKVFNDYTKKDDSEWWMEVVEWCMNHNINDITIMAGSHLKVDERSSFKYIEDIKNLLNDSLLNVHLQIGNSPDRDILTAYNSNYFISTGGTFGNLMKVMAKLNNVKVFETKKV